VIGPSREQRYFRRAAAQVQACGAVTHLCDACGLPLVPALGTTAPCAVFEPCCAGAAVRIVGVIVSHPVEPFEVAA
jgi:hypothetical protein